MYSEFLSYRGRRLGVHDEIKIVASKIEQGPVTTKCAMSKIIWNENAQIENKIV